ncbi:MAG: LytR/AlgR family response regulator transcription factor [Vicinamibacterales bacterium]
MHALDYLLKPYGAERFKSALGHARQHLSATRTAGRLPSAHERHDRLVIKSSGRIYFIRTRDIDWCEAAGNYVRLHVGPQTHFVRGTMAHIESQLDRSQFVRILRSTIVNVDRIQELHSGRLGKDALTADARRSQQAHSARPTPRRHQPVSSTCQ